MSMSAGWTAKSSARSRSSPAAVLAMWRAGVGCSEAPMDVVVDHADVLHEGVHTRGPDEAVPLRFQLLGERFGVRRRRGEVRERPRCTRAGAFIGLGECVKARR